MANDRENYCRLIGLNPNKGSTYSPESIESKIDEKEKKWTKEFKDKQNDLDRRFVIGKILELVPDMHKVMSDPALKAKEFADGRRVLAAKASKLNKDSIILHDGTRILLPGTADALVKKLGWDNVSKADLVEAAGIKDIAPAQIVSPKVANAFAGMRDVGAYTPMDVLNELIDNTSLEINVSSLREGCSLSDMRNAFDICEKRVANVKQDILPTQDSYIQTLRAIKTILDDDSAMTLLVKYGNCMKTLAPAMSTMDEDYGQPFSREYIDNLMNAYVRGTDADMNMSIAILEDYCIKKKYLSNFSTKDSKLIICPNCGGMTESSGNAMCCSICGFSIKTKCPNCNTEQSSGNKTCIKCGFDFQDSLNKAKLIEERFKKNLGSGLLQKADEDLKNLKKTYSTYPNLNELSQDLTTSTAKYDTTVKNIEQSYKMKKFKSCQMYCEKAINDFPYIIENDVELRKKYEESIQRVTDAETLCKKAEETKDEDARMALFVSAAERCPDHPATKAKMMGYPPESPADASVQIREGRALLKFAIPEERKNTTFCIYRTPDRLPTVNEDTEPLTEIANSVYLDKTMDPGIDYYYSVYSKRYGILSKEAANCGPITVFVEVENVIIEPIGGGLRISYEKPKGCSKVRIWRKEGTNTAGTGDEIELNHNGVIPFDDYGLVGGVKYYYLFVAEYENKGKIERSMGSAFSGTTIKFPDPVRDMEVRWNKSDGSFTAKWKSKEQVSLYYSPKKVTMYGRMIQLSDLNSWMKEVQPLETYEDGMRFMLPDGAVHYIYPMISAGNVAVRGKDVMVANLKPFRDVEKKMSGNDCDLTMNWPNDAETAIIAIKDDSPVTDPNDITAERVTVSREAYNSNKIVRIPMGNSKKRVATIFAQYDVDGERLYSRGMSINIFSGDYNKVKYKIEVEKASKVDSKILLSIETEPQIKELPAMCAICVSEGIPLKMWDGVSIWTSKTPTPLNNGKTVITFMAGPKLDLSKVRLFFLNEEEYHNFKFIHPLYKES
jgi:hypothetical protein